MEIDTKKPIGPNVKKLMFHKVSLDAIPPGCGNGLAAGIEFLSDKEKIIKGMRSAYEWVMVAIEAVKTAPNNPFGDDDEAIAGEILRQVEERQKQQRKGK